MGQLQSTFQSHPKFAAIARQRQESDDEEFDDEDQQQNKPNNTKQNKEILSALYDVFVATNKFLKEEKSPDIEELLKTYQAEFSKMKNRQVDKEFLTKLAHVLFRFYVLQKYNEICKKLPGTEKFQKKQFTKVLYRCETILQKIKEPTVAKPEKKECTGSVFKDALVNPPGVNFAQMKADLEDKEKKWKNNRPESIQKLNFKLYKNAYTINRWYTSICNGAAEPDFGSAKEMFEETTSSLLRSAIKNFHNNWQDLDDPAYEMLRNGQKKIKPIIDLYADYWIKQNLVRAAKLFLKEQTEELKMFENPPTGDPKHHNSAVRQVLKKDQEQFILNAKDVKAYLYTKWRALS